MSATKRVCSACDAPVTDGPFRFCVRCRKVDLRLTTNGRTL